MEEEKKTMEVARDGSTIIPTPKWVLVVRIFQFILSLLVVIMAGWFIHSLYLDALGFAIACVSYSHLLSILPDSRSPILLSLTNSFPQYRQYSPG
jgi:hypothetical protein